MFSASRHAHSIIYSHVTMKSTAWQSVVPSFIAQLLSNAGYPSPSPVQVKALPLVRLGVDVVVHARAGTGKTLIFAISTAEKALEHASSSKTKTKKDGRPRVLFVAPTREIALQGAAVLSDVSLACGLTVVTCIGGLPVAEDERLLRKGCDVVLGTPGRLAALVERKSLDTSCVDMLVLDEADRLTENPFYADVNRIVDILGSGRSYQMVALSATFESPSIERLEALRSEGARTRNGGNTLFVCTEMSTPPSVVHYRLDCHMAGPVDKEEEDGGEDNNDDCAHERYAVQLEQVFGRVPFRQAIVFCPSRKAADGTTQALVAKSHAAALLSSDMDQLSRIRALNDLRQYRTRILVCTDVASRGIDLPNVDLVCNVGSLPTEPSTLRHRIGRAGRFGQPGIAVTLREICRDDSNVEVIGNVNRAVKAIVDEALDFREYRGEKLDVEVSAPESIVIVRHVDGTEGYHRVQGDRGGRGDAGGSGVVATEKTPAVGAITKTTDQDHIHQRIMEASLFSYRDSVLALYASHFDTVVQSCMAGTARPDNDSSARTNASLRLLTEAFAKVEDVDASDPGFSRNARSLGTVQSRGLEASLAEPEDVLMAVMADRDALAREAEAFERMMLG